MFTDRVRKAASILGLLCAACTQTDSIEGCYLSKQEIADVVTGKSEEMSSYVKVGKSDGGYRIEGLIWGANFHICRIDPVAEDSDLPLQFRQVDNKLTYSHSEPEYDIDCDLELTFKDGLLTFTDSNYHCSQYVFSCGVRAGLHEIELPKVDHGCP